MDVSKILALFESKLVMINLGTELFADAAEKQGCEVIKVDWRPVAAGDKKLQDILDVLGF